MANEFEITKVRLIIRQFLWETRKAVESAEAAQKWLIQFRNTLEYQELEENPDAYALAILAEARSFNDQQRRKGQMLGVRKQLAKEGIDNPTQEQLEECWMELYGKQETTEDGDIREDSQDIHDGSNSGRLESGTSANHSEARKVQARESRRTGTAVPELRRAAHSPAPARTSGPMPEERQVVIDFAAAEGLDVDDACECWYVTMCERNGFTADGKKITSWKAYVRKWCATRKNNRRSA